MNRLTMLSAAAIASLILLAVGTIFWATGSSDETDTSSSAGEQRAREEGPA